MGRVAGEEPAGRGIFIKIAPTAHLFRQKSKIFATFPKGEGIVTPRHNGAINGNLKHKMGRGGIG